MQVHGSNSTEHAIELSKASEKVGADAVLLVTPYYNKTTQAGLYEHYKAIAENINIPIILYNVPSRTNLNINPETVKKLSEIENIVAIKECNFNQVAEIKKLCGEDFAIYSGEDANIVPLLSLGGDGVISAIANVVPSETSKIVSDFFEGRIKESAKLQIDIIDLIKALFIEVNPIPVKAALNLMGKNVGKCRLPLVEMSEKNLEILKTTLQKHNII